MVGDNWTSLRPEGIAVGPKTNGDSFAVDGVHINNNAHKPLVGYLDMYILRFSIRVFSKTTPQDSLKFDYVVLQGRYSGGRQNFRPIVPGTPEI